MGNLVDQRTDMNVVEIVNLIETWRMVSSGMLRRVALVRTNVSEELSASFIRVTRIGELGTTPGVTRNRCTLRENTMVFLRSVRRLLVTANVVPSSPIFIILMKEALSSSETSVITRATRRNILEDTILHSHSRENLKSYLPRLELRLLCRPVLSQSLCWLHYPGTFKVVALNYYLLQ
jgi:hypothetical protein